MNIKLEISQNKFLERIGRMSDAFGLNSFVAKLYGFLYFNARAISLDEIAEGLGVSKGNVSINIRELEKWGAVKKVWIKGSRKDFYEAELDIKKVFTNKIKSAVQKRISDIADMTREVSGIIASADGELTPEEENIARGYSERLKKIEEINIFASTALSFTERLI